MTGAGVAELLEALRARGCAKVRATFDGDAIDSIEVEFAAEPAAPVPAAQFVDARGAPVDLDAGAGPLTRDPDEPVTDAAIERANFGSAKA